MMLYLMSHPDHAKYKTGSLYRTVSGGAALPEQVRVMFSKVFPGRTDQGYGMSESCGIATVYNVHETYRPGSAGRAVPGLTIRIVDDNNQPLPPREVGEICLIGPNISSGYWNDASATEVPPKVAGSTLVTLATWTRMGSYISPIAKKT